MKSKERILSILCNKKPDKIPFAPAIYEHKAALINKTPSEVSQNVDLLCYSIEKEYETYQTDILVVGIDIYNIEAEALGCEVNYNCGNEVPTIKNRILNDSNLKDLKIPNPLKDGRMPIIIEASKKICTKYGNDVYICCGVSGPFSLASSLMGDEDLLITSIENPEYLNDVLGFTTEVIKKYSQSILETGSDVIVFDSASAPPLVSPNQFKENILPFVKDLFNHLKTNGSKFLSYIVGGNTISNVDSYIEAGIKNIICDFNANINEFIEKAKTSDITIRKNINPLHLINKNKAEIKNEVTQIMELSNDFHRLIIGTGILPYNTDPEMVQHLKKIIYDFIL
ncbi:MAG TPA: uroporphyrinogen decarboxylase family protein [Ignavibacteria bacterium]